MNTTTTTSQIFKDAALQQFADTLKAAGMRIFYSPYKDGRLSTYFYFTDGTNIGYCQDAYFGGIQFSTVHKPNKNCGTGFGLDENGIYEPTVEDALRAFIIAPNWAKPRDRQAVVKFKSWDEFFSRETILTYIEY